MLKSSSGMFLIQQLILPPSRSVPPLPDTVLRLSLTLPPLRCLFPCASLPIPPPLSSLPRHYQTSHLSLRSLVASNGGVVSPGAPWHPSSYFTQRRNWRPVALDWRPHRLQSGFPPPFSNMQTGWLRCVFPTLLEVCREVDGMSYKYCFFRQIRY